MDYGLALLDVGLPSMSGLQHQQRQQQGKSLAAAADGQNGACLSCSYLLSVAGMFADHLVAAYLSLGVCEIRAAES